MGCAVLAGPHMDDFVEPTAELRAAGGVQTVSDADGLAAAVVRLLGDPSLARQRGSAARRVAELEWVALSDLIATLAPLLPSPAIPQQALTA
jgi:3-deoxy-D-manno-octulosonic-acid transferase